MTALRDLEALRERHSLPAVAGAVVKLKRAGNEWKACCPFHSDRTPSFTIFDNGRRFQCFGCGASGDVLDFVQRLHNVGLRQAAEMLSGGELPSIAVASLLANDQGDRLDEARSIWGAASPIEGTVAETYLRKRGITCELPISLRFAELPYGRRGPIMPCLVACVSGPDRPVTGIQRTYLTFDGREKADVRAPRLSLGRLSGGAVRLGPPDGDELIVVEGLEDGLSVLQELGRPSWVACGTAMLPAMRFPPSIRRVAIGGDNDEAGRAAAEKAASAFGQRGLSVRVFYPGPPAKDFNEMLNGRAAQ